MGMGTAANCGYMLPINVETVEKFRKDFEDHLTTFCCKFNKDANSNDFFNEVMEVIDDQNGEHIVLHIGNTEIRPDIYRYDADNGDRYDTIEDGHYLFFSDEDIFVPKKLNETGETMKCKGILPTFQMWTTFG